MRQPAGELDSAQVEQMLKRRMIARLVCQGDGSNCVGTVRYYAFDLPDVYVCEPDDACTRLTHANPRVRFEVDDVESPGRWETVVGWGTIEELNRAAAPGPLGEEPGRLYRIHLSHLRGFYRGSRGVAT
jgi:nitroimidazol reductase NimA-like FMN-containing flavoprotein (pyridoxamine 5'-phosphate oxidase superfamily)